MVLQHDLLDQLQTRVVAPLLPPEAAGPPIRGLCPEIPVDGARYVLMPQLMATLTLAELGEHLGSAEAERNEVIRALDLLTTGV